MNTEKNCLIKIYSVNHYPDIIEFNEVKMVYQFDTDLQVFKPLNDIKRFGVEVHGCTFQFKYKKLIKG